LIICFLLAANNWGKERKNFYGTSYVDKDFGGVANSEEEEILDLEEEEAINRQRKLNSALSKLNWKALGTFPATDKSNSNGLEDLRNKLSSIREKALKRVEKKRLPILDKVEFISS
jgi:hypothetical protein